MNGCCTVVTGLWYPSRSTKKRVCRTPAACVRVQSARQILNRRSRYPCTPHPRLYSTTSLWLRDSSCSGTLAAAFAWRSPASFVFGIERAISSVLSDRMSPSASSTTRLHNRCSRQRPERYVIVVQVGRLYPALSMDKRGVISIY